MFFIYLKKYNKIKFKGECNGNKSLLQSKTTAGRVIAPYLLFNAKKKALLMLFLQKQYLENNGLVNTIRCNFFIY